MRKFGKLLNYVVSGSKVDISFENGRRRLRSSQTE